MTPEEMRVAIAEAQGFSNLRTVREWEERGGPDGYDGWFNQLRGTQSGEDRRVPEYPTDRNAMADAVAHAVSQGGFPFQEAYTCELRRIVTRRRRDLNEMQIDFWMAEADAAQRAEAFCRVFWPERFQTS